MKTLLILFVLALLIGPLRRPILRHARFTLPAIFGGLVGFAIGSFVMAAAGVPPPLSFLIPLAMSIGLAVSLGETVKDWCDKVFGRKDQTNDRRRD